MRDGENAPDLLSWTWQAQEDLSSVVLLHGSGQDENALLAFSRTVCPGHTLVAVRGHIPWEGGFAFFRRRPDRTLDEADRVHGAAALHRLLGRLHDEGHRPPPARLLERSDRCGGPRSCAIGGCHPARSCCAPSRPFPDTPSLVSTATRSCS